MLSFFLFKIFKIQCIFPSGSTSQLRRSERLTATGGGWPPWSLDSTALEATTHDMQRRKGVRRKSQTNLMNLGAGVCEGDWRTVKEEASEGLRSSPGGQQEKEGGADDKPKASQKKGGRLRELTCCREGL